MTRLPRPRRSWTWVTTQTSWPSSVVLKSPRTLNQRSMMRLTSQLAKVKVSNPLLLFWLQSIRSTLTSKTPLFQTYSMMRKKVRKVPSELLSVFRRSNLLMLENGLNHTIKRQRRLLHWRVQRVETLSGKSNSWSRMLQPNLTTTPTESFCTPTKVLAKTSSTTSNPQTSTQMMLTERNWKNTLKD